MRILTALLLIFLISLAVRFIEKRRYKRKVRIQLSRQYGKKLQAVKPDETSQKHASIYYNLIKEQFPEDSRIDEITWDDLDMDSIFSRINGTVSSAGEQMLFSGLHILSRDKQKLGVREKVMQYYDAHERERVDAQFKMQNLSKSPVHFYLPEYVNSLEEQKVGFSALYKLLSCTLILSVCTAAVTINQTAAVWAGIHFVINLAVYAAQKMKYELEMESLYGILRTVKTAGKLLEAAPEDWFEAGEELKKLRPVLRKVTALENRKQSQITGDIHSMAADYICGAFMWDFLVYDSVIRLLLIHRESFLRLYQFVGEMDLCIAVSSFRKSLDSYCIPALKAEREFCAEGLYHPLIEEAVGNDFTWNKNMLITGSNASGKSTFIKAAAVNLILGQTIHTCTAKTMTLPDAGVLTSMAVRDDVLSGESYYIREIRYLKRMIERSGGERLIFCGIDEILRGTNTPERVAASLAILEYLNGRNCILMAASHDVDLAEKVEGIYDNYHFCESVKEGDVFFDYKLRPGISRSKNALRLLETMEFPKEIVERAKGLEGSGG